MPERVTKEEKIVELAINKAKEILQDAEHLGTLELDEDVMGEEVKLKRPKKNPSEEISEPIKPIVYWIENTTPLEFRQIIKEGVERWNLAFEKAGFKNAVQVKIQPDTADWDAGDIRYNVLRWTSSPNPPYIVSLPSPPIRISSSK